MKIAAMFGSSTGAVGAAAGGAVLLIAGAVGYTVMTSQPDPDESSPPAVQAVAPEVEPSTPDVAEVAEPAEVTVPPSAPLLDIVRVEPDGSTLIAGQTDPGLAVAILLDGVEVALSEADGAGDFVAFLTLPPSDSPRMISAEARPEAGGSIPGPEAVLVAPFALASVEPDPVVEGPAEAGPVDGPDDPDPQLVADADESSPIVNEDVLASTDPLLQDDAAGEAEDTAATVAAPGADAPLENVADAAGPATQPASAAPQPSALSALPDLAQPSVSASAGAANAPIAAQPALSTPQPSQSPAVLIAGPDGLRIAQGPGTPSVQTQVQLDAISYDAEGAVILAGRGPATADIQVYLNNQPIQLGEVGPNGAWSLQLPDVDPGTYTLAVAELAEDGSVESVVETPFLREDPERVVEAPAQAAAQGIDVITVQPGFTLWGIAENNFGEGILYVQIFEENRDQIRDPNWIFPGQIFRLPDMEEEAQN